MKPWPVNPVPRFAAGVALAMPAGLAFWWFLGLDYCVFVLRHGTALATEWFMARYIVGLEVKDNAWVLGTSLSPIDNPLILVGILISPNRFTISFPLFWGLVLATPGAAKIKQLVAGTLLLVPLALLMLLLWIQFQLGLYINHQAALTQVPPSYYVLAWPYPDYLYHLMGLGRQLSLLVLPTLTPLLLWGWFNRRFIRFLVFESVLARIRKQAATARNGEV